MSTLKTLYPILIYRFQLQHQCNNYTAMFLVSQRCKSTDNRNKSGSITRSTTQTQVDVNVKPLGEKVKETTKTASYMGIILLGVGVTGTLFYAVFNELFSSKSPNNIYTKAVKICKADTRVEDKLGLPITAFGQETRRGRRQHVSHSIFIRDGRKCIRMKFYLKGAFQKGTVHLEMVENDFGDYEYRYLFVEIDDILQTTIVLEDNRNKFESAVTSTPPSNELVFS